MIREIERDVMMLSRKAAPAGKEDIPTAKDLVDTLRAHHDQCVGMAANMIGIPKAVIAVDTGTLILTMFNPKIIKKEKPYDAKEGCLSLSGIRNTSRYEEITVQYQDLNWKMHTSVFRGFTAEIIQHEVDHCNGIVI
jgi:peptide deformylase